MPEHKASSRRSSAKAKVKAAMEVAREADRSLIEAPSGYAPKSAFAPSQRIAGW